MERRGDEKRRGEVVSERRGGELEGRREVGVSWRRGEKSESGTGPSRAGLVRYADPPMET